MKNEKMLKEFGYEQMMICDINYDFVSFEFNDVDIINPFMDENGIDYVNPEAYYGKINFEKWKNEAISKINK